MDHPKPFRVCLLGASLDCTNKGVAALAAGFFNLALRCRPEAEVALFIGNRSSENQAIFGAKGKVDVKIINFRMSLRGGLAQHGFFLLGLACLIRIVPLPSLRRALIQSNARLKAVFEADFVGDIRGGDSFSDIYGLENFILGTIPSLIALLLGKKLVLLPQTYGPYKTSLARWIARLVIRNSALILSRDKESLHFLRELLGEALADRLDIRFCPDVAFSLESILPDPIDARPPLNLAPGVVLIGLNVSGLLYNSGAAGWRSFGLSLDYRSFIVALAERLLQEPQTHLLLISHTFGPIGTLESDPAACQDVMNRLEARFQGRIHLLQGMYDQFRIKGIIGQCQFFVGSRMHACIAAMSQGIPAVAVAYSKKFAGVYESVGQSGMIIDGRTAEPQSALDFAVTKFRDRERCSAELSAKVGEAKALQTQTFEEIISGKRPPCSERSRICAIQSA